VFEPFRRGDPSSGEGLGVGLYLVRMLARSLGGNASVEDRAGGGMGAIIRLPQRRTEDATAPALMLVDSAGTSLR
jgi:signal transduction histidine kinase